MKYFIYLVVLFIFLGCGSNVIVPEQKISTNISNLSAENAFRKYSLNEVEEQDILKQSISYPKNGELNSYEVKVDDTLENVYKSYLSGEAKIALKSIAIIKKNSNNSKKLWQASMLKMKVLVMMGMADDAISEYGTCQKYEKLSFNSNLNCLALRGETYVWSGDFKAAQKDLFLVLQTIGDWNLPTNYMSPPSNMPELVSITTAQLRAYTSIAAMYILEEKYDEAYKWAKEADKRYNSILFVSNHWLYGKFLNLHLDTYYGQASNLTFLAAAELSQGKEKEAENNFSRANEFFKMINYKKGIATVLAFKARVLNRTGQHKRCDKAGAIALKYSLENGFLDFVWRIEALRGETYAKLGNDKKAEAAYRRASNTINSLSSALSSDLSKRRFGFSKDDITLALLDFDKKNKNYEQLFIDAEKNRARAFVDMLATRNIQVENQTLQELYTLDKEINEILILNSAVTQNEKNRIDKLKLFQSKKDELSKKLYSENPKLSSVVSVWSSSLAQTQKSLENNTLIYFLPSYNHENIDYLILSKNSIYYNKLDISYSTLNEKLKKLSLHLGIDTINVRGLKKIASSKDVDNNSLNGVLASLSKTFSINTPSKNVYIVASDTVSFIPWGMLDIDFVPSILPTASWINLQDIEIKSDKTVILGDPSFGGEVTQLSGARTEAQLLSYEYATNAIMGPDATKETLYKNVEGGVNTLHFATHGVFYKNKPLESSLLLSDGKKVDKLSADEIYKKPIKANLVVLSACDSGLGSSSSAQDYLGLSRSFFLGGSKSVLSSLYSIDDKGTTEFMKVFHKDAKNGNYALGYKTAIKSLKSKGYSPAVYGAFVLQGLKGKKK